MSATPQWLAERVNDPYGTPNKDYDRETGQYVDSAFWAENPAEQIGVWKVFEKDGLWYAYKTTQNAWSVGFATKAEAVAMAQGPQTDVWA